MVYLHCALAAAQCIVIGPVCLFMAEWVAGCVIVGGSVTTNHDNSKLRASILTKLGLYVKVVTICSWLNFGHPMPPGRGSVAGRYFLALPYYSQHTVFASLWVLFSFCLLSALKLMAGQQEGHPTFKNIWALVCQWVVDWWFDWS